MLKTKIIKIRNYCNVIFQKTTAKTRRVEEGAQEGSALLVKIMRTFGGSAPSIDYMCQRSRGMLRSCQQKKNATISSLLSPSFATFTNTTVTSNLCHKLINGRGRRCGPYISYITAPSLVTVLRRHNRVEWKSYLKKFLLHISENMKRCSSQLIVR